MAHNGKDLHKRDPLPVTDPHANTIRRIRFIAGRPVTIHLTREQVAAEERRKRMAAKAFRERDDS